MTSALFPTTPEGASAGAELVTSDGRTLALVGARLTGDATGGLARLVLEQTFANHFSDVLKVTYRMPLPADGAVSGYEFVIGERTVKGVVDKKQRARERFEQAIASGRTAALLEQERADIFTQQIGNIPPGERVIARITVDQKLVWLPEGEWELRFPTVIGPRYVGSADTIIARSARASPIRCCGARSSSAATSSRQSRVNVSTPACRARAPTTISRSPRRSECGSTRSCRTSRAPASYSPSASASAASPSIRSWYERRRAHRRSRGCVPAAVARRAARSPGLARPRC
ncbi:MAG: VIT domain-containing protein [Deltaproteobacteria bacterium]